MNIPLEGAKREKWPKRVVCGNVTVKVYRIRHDTAATGWTYVMAHHEGGIRKRTKFSTAEEAVSEARLKAEQLNAGRVEGAEMSRGDRDELQAARAIVGNIPLMAALKEWAEANRLTESRVLDAAKFWRARNVAKHTRHKVADVVSEFCKSRTKAGFNVAEDHASVFESMKTELGEHFIDSVSTKTLETWLAKRENPVSRNTYRKRLVSVWRWAQKRGYLPRDARTEAEQTERAREEAPPIGIITADTFSKVLNLIRTKAPDDLSVAVIAGFGGLRRAEIHGQAWEDINLREKFIRVTRAKKGTPARRLVPLSDAAVKWLMLCTDREGPICYGMGLDRVRKLAKEAKIDMPDNCFRHGYISHRVAQTGSVAETSLEAGNSPKIIHAHYRELVTKKEGQAWFSITPTPLADVQPIDSVAS